VEHFAERRFAVLGQVQKPGNFDFPQNESVNLLKAIAIAGGYTRLGSPSKVDVPGQKTVSQDLSFGCRQHGKDPKNKPLKFCPTTLSPLAKKLFRDLK